MTTTARFPTTTVHRSHFDGQVLYPGTRGYDSARSVWNGMIDHRPKLIVRCASVGDVVTAVRAPASATWRSASVAAATTSPASLSRTAGS